MNSSNISKENNIVNPINQLNEQFKAFLEKIKKLEEENQSLKEELKQKTKEKQALEEKLSESFERGIAKGHFERDNLIQEQLAKFFKENNLSNNLLLKSKEDWQKENFTSNEIRSIANLGSFFRHLYLNTPFENEFVWYDPSEVKKEQPFFYVDFLQGFPSSLIGSPFFELLKKIHEQKPDIPESILVGATLSCLSFPLIFLTNIHTHKKSPFPFPAGIFFVGEMESGSGKTLLLKTFTEIYNKKINKINKQNENNLNEYNNQILPIFSNATTAGIQNKLQSKKSSFFGLIGSEKSLINAIFFSQQGKGISGDHSLYMNGWDGEIESVARGSREFDPRKLACMICLFTQKGVIQEIFEKSDGDGFAFRFFFSSEPRKRLNGELKEESEVSQTQIEVITNHIKPYVDYIFDYLGFLNEGKKQDKNLSFENYFESMISVFPLDDEDTNTLINEIKKEENRKNEAFNSVGDFSTASFYGKSILHILKIANVIHFFNLSFSDQKTFKQKQILDLETIKAAQYLFSRFSLVFENYFNQSEISAYYQQKEAVLKFLKEKSKAKFTKTELIQAVSQRKPFSILKNKAYKVASLCVKRMIEEDFVFFDENLRKMKINEKK